MRIAGSPDRAAAGTDGLRPTRTCARCLALEGAGVAPCCAHPQNPGGVDRPRPQGQHDCRSTATSRGARVPALQAPAVLVLCGLDGSDCRHPSRALPPRNEPRASSPMRMEAFVQVHRAASRSPSRPPSTSSVQQHIEEHAATTAPLAALLADRGRGCWQGMVCGRCACWRGHAQKAGHQDNCVGGRGAGREAEGGCLRPSEGRAH